MHIGFLKQIFAVFVVVAVVSCSAMPAADPMGHAGAFSGPMQAPPMQHKGVAADMEGSELLYAAYNPLLGLGFGYGYGISPLALGAGLGLGVLPVPAVVPPLPLLLRK